MGSPTLAELDWNECRRPVNNAAPGEPHQFCAGPRVPGKPYCAGHCERAGAGYQLGRSLMRAA
ncbi:hypothetical protein [Allomesorhizobium camelthorni]|uniref:GcrA cell cycle regulator n=1 Tax=Allomesorhizobium camelthorni TaxID=475069 RepID=A0A6G4W898_9HYPH|nr:hypothetical protein [Mesorhizobium camelthorni]NGO50466.1 hypothetical protein [Mesorhizobium camelthorni]